MKVACYCRVSTRDQNPEIQEVRLVEFCNQKGIKYDIFTEIQSTRETRPVKQDLLTRCRAGEYQGIIIYRLDRWARSSRELILEIQELIDKGIAFHSLTENLDFSTAAGKLHFEILAAFASFERALIRERTMEGLARARAKGNKPTGRPKGSKDKKPRRKIGYLMRRAREKQAIDQAAGIYKEVEHYL